MSRASLVALVVVVLAAVGRSEISNELHFRAPPLFHLDDYERCHFYGGYYCLGDFELWSDGPNNMYDELMVSSNQYLLNRSLLHRGLCLSSCPDGDEHEPAARFERCVDQGLHSQYGLRAKLQHLHYCKNKRESRPIDLTDLLVAAAVLVVILLNAVGTVYDLRRNPDEKPNRLLLAWSFRTSWHKLTTFQSGDPRLDVLHGLKVHLTIVVVMAHSVFAMFSVYVHDPRIVDQNISAPYTTIFQNGTIVVPTFATVTAFLLGYMTLLHFEKTNTKPSVKHWPLIIIYRYLKMTPTVIFVVAVTATWFARVQDGPMWALVEQLEAACRAKWWTHLLYVNNFVNPDQRCLVQTWFMAVDMQMFVPLVALTLLLVPRAERAPRVLAAVYVAVLAALLAFNVKLGIEPMNSMATAEGLRTMFVGNKSYNLMYAAPWTNAISSLHGLLLAFVFYNYQKRGGWNPAPHKWIRMAAWFVCPVFLALIFTGRPMRFVTSPLYQSIYATFAIPVFNAVTAFSIWCYLHQLSGFVSTYLSWRGFQLLGRMSLSTMLVHWHFNLGSLAMQTRPIEFTVVSFLMNWFAGIIATILMALPLHLMVELPTQKTVDLIM